MRRWCDWDWRERSEEPRAWTDAAERLVSMNHIKDPWDGPVRARAAAALYHANACGMLAVVRCNAEALRDLRDCGQMHNTIIPAGFARTQAELDAVAAELLAVDASCRALWLEPREELDVSRWLQVVKPIQDDPHATFLLQEAVRDGSGDGPRAIGWVVVSGGDDPIHPSWLRSIRDQCAAAGVPFTFRSWGEWQLGSTLGKEPDVERILLKSGHLILPHRVHEDTTSDERLNWGFLDPQWVARVGRERSGALLDGVEHDGRPEVAR